VNETPNTPADPSSASPAPAVPTLSICVPVFNEAENLPLLLEAIVRVVDPHKIATEVIFVDDGSTDASWTTIESLVAKDARVRGVKFAFNCGETAASDAGLRAARGRFVMTMDADLQNDPADIPKFLEALSHGWDCVCGSRVATRGKGDNIIRVISSRTANWVRNKLSDEQISDAGCTYRAFRRECVGKLKLYRGLHRFIPTLLKMEGFTVTEIAVTNNPRLHGESKYGVWNRLFKSFRDLLAIRWMKTRLLGYQIAKEIEQHPSNPDAAATPPASTTHAPSAAPPPKPRRPSKRPRLQIAAGLLLIIAAILAWGSLRIPAGDASGTSLTGPPATRKAGDILHVAAFNIAGGVSPYYDDKTPDLHRTVAVLGGYDLISLEEVHGSLTGPDQAELIGQQLHLPWLFAPTERQWWHDSFANALLTDLPVKSWQRTQASGPASTTNRNRVVATVTWRGQTITVILSHLDRHADRENEMRSLIDFFRKAPAPAILMGDLNTTTLDPILSGLRNDPAVVDCITRFDSPNLSSGNLDWIFSRGLDCTGAGLRLDDASDHPVAWADFRVSSASTQP
jgi:endonuclease/exonuclease/phosphatase family metal-dependent hydrolase